MKIPSTVLTMWLCLGAALPVEAQLSETQKAAVLLANRSTVEANVVYKVANRYEAKLDVYHPSKASAPTPVLMMIHGGGWLFGTKEDMALQILPFLHMGFSVVNVEYRMGSVSPAPAAVEDCLCALHWIGRNAQKYGFDTSKVVVTGGSAGGHLALTTAMIPASAGFENECAFEDDPGWTGAFVDSRPKVAAVINWFGITDVADLIQGPNMKGYAVSWLGGAPNRDDLARRVSPLTYVRGGLPPILTIHGDADKLVPYSHATRLHEALTKAGVRNELLTMPGAGHGDFTDEQELKAYEAMRAFLVDVGVIGPAQ